MQHDQNPAKLTFIKGDPRDMNQPIAQNKPSSPLNQKHSAGSESSSETNLESEHADVVGTPLMTADTSDAGVHVGSTDEGKGEGKEAMSKDQTKVSLVENMTSDSASPVTKRPQTNKQRTYLFPEKVISCIIEHAFQLSIMDPVMSPLDERRQPFWRSLFPQSPVLWDQLESRWRLLRFASWLRDLQSIKDTWSAAVENHPFWATFLNERPIVLRENEMGSSKGQETPAWLDRVHPGRKQAKNHSSLQAEAEKTCWLCVLYHGPDSRHSKPPIARTHMETTAFQKIPVCERHFEMSLCHCCLQWDTQEKNSLLTRQQDTLSFRLHEWNRTEVCRTCRLYALEKAWRQHDPPFTLSPVPSSAQVAFMDHGQGTAAEVVEQLYAIAWATENLNLAYEWGEETKRFRNHVKNDYLRRNLRCPPTTQLKLPLDKVYNLFVSVLQWDVDRMIDSGLWISPRAISDRLKEAAQTGCPTEAALPLMDIYNPPLQNPTLRKRELDVSEDWAYKDRVPPRLVVAIMQRTYIDILPDRIEATLKSLKTMVSKISDGNMDLAEAKAASMDVNELLAWLNDPRMHIANWWHGQPIIKPITQTDIARVLSSKSPAAESVSKRKRDDSDLSDDETGKMTKRQDNRSAAVSTLSKAERATDVVLDNVGPPTPTEPEMQPSSPSTPSNNFQTSLFMLAPEKVNQLPWPKPQIVLSERECEYLRMTEYNEKKVKSDSLYSVPARCSELDEVTKEIIMQQWQNITASFSICRCTVCRRAREYEKLLVAESTNQYSEYISLLSSETRTEDMTDFQRTWLANQAALLKTSIASPEEDLEQEELQLSEEEEEDANWPAIRDRNELEHYSDGYEYDESDDEMKEVPNADDVAYDTPGARLQQDPR